MDFEEILAKCGNSSRYQFVLLALYGYLMIVVSMHYFSQNVISFVPDHWCYHEQAGESQLRRNRGDIFAIRKALLHAAGED